VSYWLRVKMLQYEQVSCVYLLMSISRLIR
jgi:hypothetical protein